MHVKSLKVFCDVVGRRSFSRAADANGMSQSGASQVVHQLEERLGVTLIDRSKRPLIPTPEGEVFYRGCRKLVEDYSALEEEVRTFHQEVAGLVRVASIYSVGLSHMNCYVQDFLACYPKANIRLQYQHPDKVYELVQRDQVDFGLVSYAKSTRDIKAVPWREETMALVCSPGHRLQFQPQVRVEELHGENMVGFDEGLRIRQALDRVLAAHDVEVNVVMEFDNIETIKRAIEINAGVGILPEPTVIREAAAGTLVAVPLTVARDKQPIPPSDEEVGRQAGLQQERAPGRIELTRPLSMIHRRGKRFGATARRFIRTLHEQAAARAGALAAPGRQWPRHESSVSAKAETAK